MRKESLYSFPSCGEQLEHCITCEEKCSNIANDTKLNKNLNATLEFTNSIWDFSFDPSFKLEILNLTKHLNIITKERADSSQRESFTKQNDESKLDDKLHVVVNDFGIIFF